MSAAAILGAGELGGALAHELARHDTFRQIQLVDAKGQVAAGKALDIMQAAPIEGFSSAVTGATDPTSAAGADVVVLADRMEGGEWAGDDALMLLKQVARFRRETVVVCAGAAQREVVERSVRELGYRRQSILGSAPEALASALRALVALEVNGSPSDVALAILGVPPGHAVVPWDDVTIGGFSAVRVLSEPVRRRLEARIAPLWPPGPYALAAAARLALAAIAGTSRRTVSAFVAPDQDGGRRTRAAALPVRLGPDGVMHVNMPALSVQASVALDNAMLL